jgi:hypothetical protein
MRLTVTWDGGGIREVEVVTGTGHWSRLGADLVEGRWVYVQDGPGPHRDEYFFTTDLTLQPQQMVEYYTQRWAIETTFQDSREDLKLASPNGYGQATVRRLTPCLLGLRFISIRPLIIYGHGSALSPAPEEVEDFESGLLAGQNDRALCRYDDVCTPCQIGTVVCSHTS